jgi:hypothetical protein
VGPNLGSRGAKATDSTGLLVGAVGIEIAPPKNKSWVVKGVAPPPLFQLVSNGDYRFQLVSMLAQENRVGFIELKYSGLDNVGVVLSIALNANGI